MKKLNCKELENVTGSGNKVIRGQAVDKIQEQIESLQILRVLSEIQEVQAAANTDGFAVDVDGNSDVADLPTLSLDDDD